jgi:hypothetical protein
MTMFDSTTRAVCCDPYGLYVGSYEFLWCGSLRHCLTQAKILPLQKIPKRDNYLVQIEGENFFI